MKNEDKSKFKYEIIKDGKIEKIRKSGDFHIDFKIDELVGAINSFNRNCNELDAEIQVRDVVVKNFKKANPKFVKYFTDENVGLINEFCVAWIELKERKEALESNRKKIKDMEAEIAEVEKQTGVKPSLPNIKYEKANDKQDGE